MDNIYSIYYTIMLLFAGDQHSLGYPLYISGEVSVICENGISNDRLVKKVIEQCEEDKFDYVVVQWGSWGRVEIYQDGWKQLKPTQYLKKQDNYKLSKLWYTNIDSEHLRSSNLWRNVYLLENYLSGRNIKHYFWMVKNNYEPVGTYIEDDSHIKQNHQTDTGNIFRDLSRWKNMETDVSLIGKDMKREGLTDYSILANKIIEVTNDFS